MYRDQLGNVTVGIGLLLRQPEDAEKLRFEVDDFRVHRAATRQEIAAAAWRRVKSAPPATIRPTFRKLGGLVLANFDIDSYARRRIGEFITQLRVAFPEYDSYPYDAQVALLDIAFNTGSVSPARWPLLTAAVRHRDWREAANQSHRRTDQIGSDRNEVTRQRFLSAAAADSTNRLNRSFPP